MTLDKIAVIISGLVGVVFTYWFFFQKKDNVVEAGIAIEGTVDGGYSPDVFSLARGKATKITFLRKDPNTCLEEVVIPNFKIRKYLPLNKAASVSITPTKPGTYDFVGVMETLAD